MGGNGMNWVRSQVMTQANKERGESTGYYSKYRTVKEPWRLVAGNAIVQGATFKQLFYRAKDMPIKQTDGGLFLGDDAVVILFNGNPMPKQKVEADWISESGRYFSMSLKKFK